MTVITNEQYRPEYHFTPETNWMNDPNGLVYYKGEYHLFYQHHPQGTTWGPMHWGHAVTTDLASWEHLPIALAPDEHGMIFSGSAVVDWHDTTGFFGGKSGLVAIFTHHDQQPGADPARQRQRQSLAYSKDEGRTWIKYEGNPVLGHDSYVDFRDPKVFWHPQTAQWVMILATGQTVSFYTSPNLKDWAFASEFGEGIGSHDGVWECPDLFPLAVDGDPANVKWVMFVSIGDDPAFAEGSRTQYFTGAFDGKTFVPDEASREIRWIDYGRDNYAGVSWSDVPAEDGRRIYVGWMSNWRYANQTPTEGWRSAMTIARELTLTERDGAATLISLPARELENARTPLVALKNVAFGELQAKLAGLELDSYEIEVELPIGANLEAVGLKVRTSADEETIIGYHAGAEELYVDRSRSGRSDFHKDFAGKHGVKLANTDGRLRLRIYVDRSSVEVFAEDGLAVMTELIFPDPESKGLTVFGAEPNAIVSSFAIYEIGGKK
ncbi:fructan beta-fructosidase [Paenibacillus phyllosphaerae]|uniref:Fructan beta-fructosidase n=1 Tax=Paenibacillus phyllosphaerae TaxID=274593 RepID=A0A7W5B5F0_9BACL|nr:glycoside hydrolase family 32 protein [Paenibacillus phyllosphaerae]MBB3113961.1 fructan beta-fructosidase [Paenibacillus phyllosphaerae]